MKAVQKFSKEYLELCRSMTPAQIIQFLEDFRTLHVPPEKSQLISIKIPPSLLGTFKTQCKLEGIPYQTQIKKLMVEWLGPVHRK